MKSIFSFMITMALAFGCTSVNDAINPTQAGQRVKPILTQTDPNARMEKSGLLEWDGTHYNAEFGGSTILIFSGPSPLADGTIPQPPNYPIPVFSLLSASTTPSTVSSTGINTFSVSFTAIPATAAGDWSFGITSGKESAGGVFTNIQDFEITGSNATVSGSATSLTLNGVVSSGDDGHYYAAATSYQAAGQPVTTVTLPNAKPLSNPITITKKIIGSTANLSLDGFFISTDDGDDWTSVTGTTIQVESGSNVTFRAIWHDAQGTIADLVVATPVGIYVTSITEDYTGSPMTIVTPTDAEQSENASHVYTSDFTVTLSIKTITVTRKININSPPSVLGLSSAQYKVGSSWRTMGSSITLGPSSTVYYQGNFTCNNSEGDFTVVVGSSSFPATSYHAISIPTTLIPASSTNYTVNFDATLTP